MSYVFVQLLSRVFGAATVFLLAATVDAEVVGEYFQVVLVAGVLQVALDFGRARSTQRVLSAGAEPFAVNQQNRRFTLWCTLGGIVGAAGYVAALAVDLGWSGLAAAPLACLMAMTAVNESTILGMGRRLSAGLVSGFASALLLALIAAVIYDRADPGVDSLLGAHTIAATIATAAAHLLVRALRGRRPSRPVVPIRLDAKATGTLNALAFVYYRADLLLVAAFLPPASLAAYTAAYRIVEIGVSTLQLLQVARMRAHVRARQSSHDSMHFNTTVVTLVAVALFAAAGLATLALVGSETGFASNTALGEALPLVALLAPLVIAVALSQSAAVATYAELGDRANIGLLKVAGASAAVSLLANAAALSVLDVMGVAGAQPMIEGVCALVNLAAVSHVLRLRPTARTLCTTVGVLVLAVALAAHPIFQASWLWVASLIWLAVLPRLAATSRKEVLTRW